MAWMNQEKKARIVAAVKPILQKYGMKGSFSVRNHSTICLTLKSGKIDFIADLNMYRFNAPDDITALRDRYTFNINHYHYNTHFIADSVTCTFLDELVPAMHSADWYDKSDIMTDYFDTAYYIDISVGSWKNPYVVTK